MSTYIDSRNPTKHSDYRDCPELVIQFLYDSEVIRNLSPRTVNGYYIDLRTFFRFWKQHHHKTNETNFQEIKVDDITLEDIQSITANDIYEFLHYMLRVHENSATTRARKLSSLKSFFKYLYSKRKLLSENPVQDIDLPSTKHCIPRYLSLNESMQLLEAVSSDFPQRDYCIFILFLSCGMRLSELITINRNDIQKEGTLRILGKGNKERLVYLNKACMQAVSELISALEVLEQTHKVHDLQALFISKHTGKRLSARRIQQIVDNALSQAGLSGKGYSVHKLRHTAATLMYQEGNVDMLALKEILGHAHISTTEIYTHLGSSALKDAADASPFSRLFKQEPTQ